MHVKLPPFNHFQSKIKYVCAIRGKYWAYAPNCTINNMKMQTALTVGGGTQPTPSPPPLARSLARYFPPPLKFKSWLRHW